MPSFRPGRTLQCRPHSPPLPSNSKMALEGWPPCIRPVLEPHPHPGGEPVPRRNRPVGPARTDTAGNVSALTTPHCAATRPAPSGQPVTPAPGARNFGHLMSTALIV